MATKIGERLGLVFFITVKQEKSGRDAFHRVPLLSGNHLRDAVERVPTRLGCSRSEFSNASSQYSFDDFARYIRESKIAACMPEGQLLVIEAEQMQNGGVEIVHVNRIFHDGMGVIVGLAINNTAFDSTPGKPGGESGVVVAAP